MILTFEPEQWHSCPEANFKTCSEESNCYAYALNRPDFYWAVPGMGFAHTQTQRYYDSWNTYFEKFDTESFRQMLKLGAARDGLIETSAMTERPGYYLTALFFPKSDKDFHWYRKDSNGKWSHKEGHLPPSNKDEEGKEITDPRQAKSNYYPKFAGFYLVPERGISLKEDFPLV